MATPPDFTAGQVLTAAQMNAIGLWEIKAQTIGTTVASVTVSNVFSADFERYYITITGGAASGSIGVNVTFGGTTTNYYYGAQWVAYTGGTGVFNGNPDTAFKECLYASGNGINCHFFVSNPFAAARTQVNYQTAGPALSGVNLAVHGGGFLNDANSYTAFTLTTASGTLTGGTIRVYGYRL